MVNRQALIEKLVEVLQKESAFHKREPMTKDAYLVKFSDKTDNELLELGEEYQKKQNDRIKGVSAQNQEISNQDNKIHRLEEICQEHCDKKSFSSALNIHDLDILDYYCRLAQWELEEAVSMLLYIPPQTVCWESIKEHQNWWVEYPDLWWIDSYGKLMLQIKRAIEAKDLKGQKGDISQANTTLKDKEIWNWETYYFKPIDFIEWAKKNNISLPEKMEELVKNYTVNYIDFEAKYNELLKENDKLQQTLKPLHVSTEKSYQKIIFLLLYGGYNLKKFDEENVKKILQEILMEAESLRDNADLKLPFELPCDKTITEHYNNSIDTLFHQNKPSIKKTKKKTKK